MRRVTLISLVNWAIVHLDFAVPRASDIPGTRAQTVYHLLVAAQHLAKAALYHYQADHLDSYPLEKIRIAQTHLDQALANFERKSKCR